VGFFDWFSPPKPPPVVIIYNVLHEEIDRVEGARDLWGGVNLRGRQWAHADLSDMWLDGSDLTGAKLFGARLKNTSFRGAILRDADLAYSLVTGARFNGADLDGADMLHSAGIEEASFDGAILSETSTVPGHYASRRRMW
jgi:uncharacterized protein YjbI with pentapeptide repeats